MPSAFEAIVDDLLIKAAGVLLAREALLQNGKSDLAIAKKTRADIVIVGVDTENVGGLLRHRSLLNRVGIAPHKRFCARLIVKIHLIAEGGRCKSDDGITGEYGSSSAGRDRNVEVVSRSRRTGSSPVHRVRCILHCGNGVGCSGGHLLDHFARSAHNSCVLSPCAQRVPHPTGGRAQCVLFRRYTSLDASCGAFLSAEWFRLDETKLEANKYGDQQLWWDFAEVSDARIGGRSASCNLRRQHSCGVRRVPHLDQHRSSGAWARPRTRPWIRAWARTWPRPWLLAWWRMGAGALPQRVEQPALLLLLSHSELRVMAGRDSGRSFLASRRECELNGQATAR